MFCLLLHIIRRLLFREVPDSNFIEKKEERQFTDSYGYTHYQEKTSDGRWVDTAVSKQVKKRVTRGSYGGVVGNWVNPYDINSVEAEKRKLHPYKAKNPRDTNPYDCSKRRL